MLDTEEEKLTRRELLKRGAITAAGLTGAGAFVWGVANLTEQQRKQFKERLATAREVRLDDVIRNPEKFIKEKTIKTSGFAILKEEKRGSFYNPATKTYMSRIVNRSYELHLTEDSTSPFLLIIEQGAYGSISEVVKLDKNQQPGGTLVFGVIEKIENREQAPEYFLNPIKAEAIK